MYDKNTLAKLVNRVMNEYATGAAKVVECGIDRMLVVRGRVKYEGEEFVTPWFFVTHGYTSFQYSESVRNVVNRVAPGLALSISAPEQYFCVLFTAPVVVAGIGDEILLEITAEFSNTFAHEIGAVYPHTIV